MTSFYQVHRGDSFETIHDLSEQVTPLPTLAPGFPKVELLEGTQLIASQLGAPHTTLPAGNYTATFVIPLGLDLQGRDFVDLTLRWTFRDTSGTTWVVNKLVQALPDADSVEIQGDVVLDAGQSSINLVLDLHLQVPDTVELAVYRNNTLIETPAPITGTYVSLGESSRIDFDLSTLPVEDFHPALQAYNLHVRGTRAGRPFVRYFRLYFVTPQIMNAATQVKNLLHKSKIERTIASLKYTQADLLQYLERGLDMFNGYPPTITAFNGTNMQGPIQQGWIVCSMIFALGAQVLAEGELSFDFSGQSVTFNVDRTPSLDAAIGRWESMLEQQIRPLKLLLSRMGNIQGNGEFNGPSRGNALSQGVVGDHGALNLYRYGNRTNNYRAIRRWGR